MRRRVKLVLSLLHACVFVFTVGRAEPGIFAPATVVSEEDFVLVDTSERAYTVFLAVPQDRLHEVRSKIEGKPGLDLVARAELERKQGHYLSSRILKNEYKGSRVVEGILQLLAKYPGAPVGLTWNGGVAITFASYQHAKETYASYERSSADYERTRVRDPRADPVRPESHFGPLLGW